MVIQRAGSGAVQPLKMVILICELCFQVCRDRASRCEKKMLFQFFFLIWEWHANYFVIIEKLALLRSTESATATNHTREVEDE